MTTHYNIKYYITGNELAKIIPEDRRINIQNLCIGKEMGRRYTSYRFGYSVENLSNDSLSIEFLVGELDKDGYTVKEHQINCKLASGDKKRVWSKFSLNSLNKFKLFVIKKVVVVSSSSLTPEGVDVNKNYTSPNKSIYNLIKDHKEETFSLKPFHIIVTLAIFTIIGFIIFMSLYFKGGVLF